MDLKILLWLLTFTSWAMCNISSYTHNTYCTQDICDNLVTAQDLAFSPRSRNIATLIQSHIHPHEWVSDAESLFGLLLDVMEKELSDCNLVLAYDDSGDMYYNVILDILMMLPNPRQVVIARSEGDLAGIMWISSGCVGYMFLLHRQQHLISYANTHNNTWDYHGRYFVLCQSVEQLVALAETKKGRKTENILGAVKGVGDGEWMMYMNQLYWGEGVKFITTWRQHRFTSKLHLFPDKLADLQGATLKVSTFELAPSIMYYRSSNGSLLFRYGEDIALTEMLARVLNFTALYAEPLDGDRWGWQVNNSHWVGMLGELYRDEADIGLANLYITANRLGALDYSAPFSDEGSCFMARVEPPLPRWQALAFPFHPWTWLALLCGLCLAGPILFIIAYTSSQCGDEIKILCVIGYCVHYAIGLHFREPQSVLPNRNSTRIFVMFLWLYTMIITIAYSTNLTAFLLVRKRPSSIQTIDDIYDSGLEVAGIGAMLKDSSENFADIYKAYRTKGEAFSRVMEGKAVFWINKGFLNFHIVTQFTHKGVPRARIMRECFMPFNVAMGLQRQSPLKKKFDEVIGWIQQSGILKQAVDEALRLAATTEEYGGGGGGNDDDGALQDDTVVALNMDHLQSVFMLVAIGWLAAITIFIFESIMHRF